MPHKTEKTAEVEIIVNNMIIPKKIISEFLEFIISESE